MSGDGLMAVDCQVGNSRGKLFGRLRAGARSLFTCATQVVESQQRDLPASDCAW
jgi:hypothetical protein